MYNTKLPADPNRLIIECSSVDSVIPLNKSRMPIRLLVCVTKYHLRQVLVKLLEDYSIETIAQELQEANK